MSDSRRTSRLPLNLSIIDRYVIGEYLISYLIAILVVMSLRVSIEVFVQIDELAENERGLIASIVEYYGPNLFLYFRDFSGIMILLAAAFSLTRMTRNNELTAILASGMSLKRLIAPIVLVGFLLNMFTVVDQEVILPALADKLTRSHDEIDDTNLEMQKVWLTSDKDGHLFNGVYDPRNRTVTDLLVILRADGEMTGRIVADRGVWLADEQAWLLENGYRIMENAPTEAVKGAEPVRKYESNLNPDFLWLQRSSSFKSLMSSSELNQMLKRSQNLLDYNETLSEKYFRYTDPIINMVMLLLGLPMLVSRERRSTKTAVVLAFAGAGGCFIATFACKLIGGSVIPPLYAAWLPIIVFLPFSIIALDELKT